MSQEIAQGSGRLAQTAVALQIALALLCLGAVVLAPRAGEPVAYLPLTKHAAQTIPQKITQPGKLLLGRGMFEGSYVVRGEPAGFFESLFGDGILIVNASAPGCGPANEVEKV